MKLYFHNEKGSTMVLSLLTMAFLTIIISGLMPLVNSQVLHSSMNNDTVEAQYAAEAGAKRAIVGIKNNRTDWTWANGTTKNTFVDGTGKYYTTKISRPIDNNTSPEANTTYTITSDGYVGNAHKRVIFEITTFGTNGNNIPLYGGAYVGSMYVKNNNSFNADIVCGTSIPGSIIGNGSGKRLENQEDMHYPEYDYDKFKSNAILLPDVDGKSNTLNESMYYYDGTLTIDKNNSNITATNPTVIFVKGDINITSNGLNLNGDIMLIATGSIITGKNHPNFSSTVLLANKDISFKNGADINGIIITPGQLSFFNNGNFNGKASLATTFNLIMDKYLSGSSDSGVSSITIHDWRNK